MAASSCYGNRNAKLEIVSIAKLPKRSQEHAAGHRAGARSAAPAGSCLPMAPELLLRASQRLSCTPGHPFHKAWLPCSLLPPPAPPSLPSSQTGPHGSVPLVAASPKHRAPLRQRRSQPWLPGHEPGGRKDAAHEHHSSCSPRR